MMSGNSNNILPLLYIVPDEQFLKLARDNKFSLTCEITDIGDGKTYTHQCTVNKSAYVPNCRPNYFAKTGHYVITLQVPWVGYPTKLGNIKFYGIKGGESLPPKSTPKSTPKKKSKVVSTAPPPPPPPTDDSNKMVIASLSIGGALILLLLILVGVEILRKKK